MNEFNVNQLNLTLSDISDGLLLTSGNLENYNTMTIGWAQTGVLWQKPVFTVYVRPNRHTFGFIEKYERFTVCFFDKGKYAEMLSYCGAKSGRDVDKAKETGITPFQVDNTVAFSEAKQILVCQKIYRADLDEKEFIDKRIYKMAYSADNPEHKIYTGEIIKAYKP